MKKETKRKVVIGCGMAALLALVGATAANTYAKYAESASVNSQQATVAKWGFVVNATAASDLFKTEYSVGEDTNAHVTVSSSTNVVAPGTSGSYTFSVTGSAEVRAKVSVKMEGFQTITLTANDEDKTVYSPVTWTLNGEAFDGTLNDETVIEVGGAAAQEYTLEWSWAFDNDDAKDTLLGKLANATSDEAKTALLGEDYTAYNLTMGWDTLTISVEQLAD